MQSAQAAQAALATLDDRELARLAQRGEPGAFRAIMLRNNRRLYRVARSVVRDESEAEDVLQEGYVRAFAAMCEFRNDASLSTWLTRIILNEALGRVRSRRPTVGFDSLDASGGSAGGKVVPFPFTGGDIDPERAAARHEIGGLLERSIDELPEPFRIVFMMRAVEEMSVEETAHALGLQPETVRTRLHRARRMLRDALASKLASALTGAFPFGGQRCARVADAVLGRLRGAMVPSPDTAGPGDTKSR